MEKLKRNLPYILFIFTGLKLLILGTSNLFDVLSLLVLGLGLAFFELRVENEKFNKISNENQEYSKKINDLDKKVNELDQKLNSVRIVQGMKQPTQRINTNG